MKNFLFLWVLIFISACSSEQNINTESPKEEKIAVLLVNHGSHSATWRQALLDLDSAVRESILNNQHISDVRTAFMEYTEPSIATRMKEFDEQGFTDIIIVPIFLTVSSHSFDDIPTIIGQKSDPNSLENLKIEKIETYDAKARCHITPLLDFTDILQKNMLRRVASLSKNPEKEGLVFIAYGDEGYNAEWSALMDSIGNFVNRKIGINSYSYGWCGHLVHYDPSKTTDAIEKVLKQREKAIVIPVLVAHDEMFQIRIIGDGIKAVENHADQVVYKPDAILPDENVENWVIDIVDQYSNKILQSYARTEKIGK